MAAGHASRHVGLPEEKTRDPLREGEQINIIANSGGGIVAINALQLLARERPRTEVTHLVMIAAYAPSRGKPANVDVALRIGAAPGITGWGDFIDFYAGPIFPQTKVYSGYNHQDFFNSYTRRELIVDYLYDTGVR